MQSFHENRLFLMEDLDIYQDFDDKNPSFYVGPEGNYCYKHRSEVDSFPCYHHDPSLILKLVIDIEEKFPISPKPYWYILPFEGLSRTNAQIFYSYKNLGGDKRDKIPVIVFSGKRIPVCKLMSEYLVAHEYGHAVESFICFKQKNGEDGNTEFRENYAKMRDISVNEQYGARKWHTNIGEIIANDFRICVGKSEVDFWPHECEHPLNNQKVQDFWLEQREKYAIKQ